MPSLSRKVCNPQFSGKSRPGQNHDVIVPCHETTLRTSFEFEFCANIERFQAYHYVRGVGPWLTVLKPTRIWQDKPCAQAHLQRCHFLTNRRSLPDERRWRACSKLAALLQVFGPFLQDVLKLQAKDAQNVRNGDLSNSNRRWRLHWQPYRSRPAYAGGFAGGE